jgi:hypothetical protein
MMKPASQGLVDLEVCGLGSCPSQILAHQRHALYVEIERRLERPDRRRWSHRHHVNCTLATVEASHACSQLWLGSRGWRGERLLQLDSDIANVIQPVSRVLAQASTDERGYSRWGRRGQP